MRSWVSCWLIDRQLCPTGQLLRHTAAVGGSVAAVLQVQYRRSMIVAKSVHWFTADPKMCIRLSHSLKFVLYSGAVTND